MIKAGYAAKTAHINQKQVMTNNNVKEAIGRFKGELEHRTVFTRQQRQQFWTDMMLDDGANRSDRLRASELLGKSEADFIDVQQSTNKT